MITLFRAIGLDILIIVINQHFKCVESLNLHIKWPIKRRCQGFKTSINVLASMCLCHCYRIKAIKPVEIQRGLECVQNTIHIVINHTPLDNAANCDFSIEFYRAYTTISMSLLHYNIYDCRQFIQIHWTIEIIQYLPETPSMWAAIHCANLLSHFIWLILLSVLGSFFFSPHLYIKSNNKI